MALVVAGLSAGIAPAPLAAAVSPDCNEEFEIADSEQDASDRKLAVGVGETGLEDVLATSGDENVTVRLLTNNDKLEFGIFELDGLTCERSQTVSPTTCQSDVVLDTTANPHPQEEVCTLQAPNLGSKDYYIHMENIGDSPLKYEIFVSS